MQLWRYATVHAQVVSVHIGSNRKGFEALNEEFVNLFVFKLLEYLGAEREVLSHGPTLVVSTQHDHRLWILDLQNAQLKIMLVGKYTYFEGVEIN